MYLSKYNLTICFIKNARKSSKFLVRILDFTAT